MLTSTQSGFFDLPATWGSSTNNPDTAPEDWTVASGHTVTIRPGHGHEDRNTTGTVAGNLVIGDVDSSNFSVRMNTLYVLGSGTVHVRAGCSIGLASVMICMGDLNLEGSIGNAIGITDSQSWLFPIDPIFSGDSRTIHVINPQNIGNASLAYGYAVEYGSAPLSGVGSGMPPDNRWFTFSYTQTPQIVSATIDNVDLNAFVAGQVAEDFGFLWNIWSDAGMPLVFVLYNGVFLDVQIAIAWVADAQWEWSFTLPTTVPSGARLMVVAAHGTASAYNVQYMRGVVTAPIYTVRLDFTRDDAAGRDEYTAVWYRDDNPATDATAVQIHVLQRADGSDLIAATNATQIASTGVWKYDEGVNRLTPGTAAIAIVTATIDGATRTRTIPIARDD